MKLKNIVSFKYALGSFIEFTLTIFHVYLHYFCQRWAKFYSRLNIYFRFEQEVMGPYDNTTNKTFFHGITRISIVLPYNYLGQWFREIFYITAFHYWYLFDPIEKLKGGIRHTLGNCLVILANKRRLEVISLRILFQNIWVSTVNSSAFSIQTKMKNTRGNSI